MRRGRISAAQAPGSASGLRGGSVVQHRLVLEANEQLHGSGEGGAAGVAPVVSVYPRAPPHPCRPPCASRSRLVSVPALPGRCRPAHLHVSCRGASTRRHPARTSLATASHGFGADLAASSSSMSSWSCARFAAARCSCSLARSSLNCASASSALPRRSRIRSRSAASASSARSRRSSAKDLRASRGEGCSGARQPSLLPPQRTAARRSSPPPPPRRTRPHRPARPRPRRPRHQHHPHPRMGRPLPRRVDSGRLLRVRTGTAPPHSPSSPPCARGGAARDEM